MIPPFLTCHVFRTCALLRSSGLWLRFPVMVGHIMFPCLPRTMEEFLWDSIRILRFHRVSKIRVTRVISSFISLRGSFEGLWRHILVSQFSELSQLIQWLDSTSLSTSNQDSSSDLGSLASILEVRRSTTLVFLFRSLYKLSLCLLPTSLFFNWIQII